MRRRRGIAGRVLAGDDGRITVLVVGYFVVVVLLVGVVAGIAALQTARQRLVALADAAAVEACQAVDEDAYYRAGLAPVAGAAGPRALPLTDEGVQEAARQSLVAAEAQEAFPSLELGVATGSPDGATAQVELVATVDVPVLPPSIGAAVGGVPITVLSRARAPLG